jgi:chromosome partitioning protein
MADAIARVLVAATAKGGAGKSTTVACLAVHWREAGRRVALLDADPNRTLTRWHAKGSALSRMSLRTVLDEHEIVGEIGELAHDHDLVLVDCAGFGNQAMVFAIGAADLVVIPAMTDEANLFEAARTHKLVASAAQATRRTIAAHTLLCRVKRSAIATHAREQLVALKTDPLIAQLNDRVIYQEATFHGSSPTDLAPSGIAAQEVALLAEELEWRLHVRPRVTERSLVRRVELT